MDDPTERLAEWMERTPSGRLEFLAWYFLAFPVIVFAWTVTTICINAWKLIWPPTKS